MKKKTKLLLWIIVAVCAILLSGLVVYNIALANSHEVKNPVATFEVENYGNIKMELYPQCAPNTVTNFINLIKKGFYNGKTFYAKDENAIFATKNADGTEASPTKSLVDSSIKASDETKDTRYEIDGEFVANKFYDNTLKHEKGVVSMLRADYNMFGLAERGFNSGSCHFQIMLEDNRNLNGVYAAFGKVTEGLDVVEKIFAIEAKAEETEEGVESATTVKELSTPAVIKNASVETYGVDYGMPQVHDYFDYNAYLQNYFTQQMNVE